MNNRYIISNTLLCILLSFFFIACGDDVINVQGAEYSVVESLDDANCNKDTEGDMSLLKTTGVLYVCTDGEWNAVNADKAVDMRCNSEALKDSTGYNIVCDDDVIGTVYNGKDGSSNKEVNIDSVSKAISKKTSEQLIDTLTETLKDGLSCQIDSNWTDTKNSEINVRISCGNGTSVITLPTLTPNANLSKHYKKTVIVRFPYTNDDIDMNILFDNNAELTVIEVDSGLEKTGKTFSYKMSLTSFGNLHLYQDPNLASKDIGAAFLQADIDVTNMINSFAQMHVRLPSALSFRESFTPISEFSFDAFVDMNNGDTIVIDFLSDYKSTRIKKLVDSGADFNKATRQANDELTDALALGKDLPIIEHYMKDTLELNEAYAAMLWPSMVYSIFQMGSYGTNDLFKYVTQQAYIVYKDVFAEKGNFKTGAILQIPDSELSGVRLFFIDVLIEMMMGKNMNFKLFQKGLADAYELPACDMSQKDAYESDVEDGYYKYFLCNKSEEIWTPAMIRNNIDILAESIVGECNEDSKGKIFKADSLGSLYIVECDGEDWTTPDNIREILCEDQKDGAIVAGHEKTGTSVYALCHKDKEGKVTADSIGVSDYIMDNVCTSSSSIKDTLYTRKNSSYAFENSSREDAFYRCDKKNGQWTTIYDLDSIVTYQLGACTDSSEIKVETAFVAPYEKTHVICNTEYNEWVEANPVQVEQGLCDVEKMKEAKVYTIDIVEWEYSALTGKEHFKCECDYIEGTTEGSGTYENCTWRIAKEADIKLGLACNSSTRDTIAKTDGVEYYCTIGDSSKNEWVKVDADKDCPMLISASSTELENADPCYYPCEYAGHTYYYSQKSGKWIQTEQCVPVLDYCEENHTEITQECEEAANCGKATICVVKDTIHEAEIMEYVPECSSSAYRSDIELCEREARRMQFGSDYMIDTEYGYMVYLNGFSMDGYELPEIFKIVNDMQRYECLRTTDLQDVCTALHPEVLTNRASSCDFPCTYKGKTYYFQYDEATSQDVLVIGETNNGGTWKTLEEMGLKECPNMDSYCNAHNTQNKSCQEVCEEEEQCIAYSEDDPDNCIEWEAVPMETGDCIIPSEFYQMEWNCTGYRFAKIAPSCSENGTWSADGR